MSCLELELAQRHLSLALKVYDSKTKEFEQAQALMGRLQEQCLEAEQDMVQAESYLHQVERRLHVVVIDDKAEEETDEESTKVGLAMVAPSQAMDEQQFSSSPNPGALSSTCRQQSSSTTSSLDRSAPSALLQVLSSAIKGVPLSTSLRRALKRHQRKVSRNAVCNEDLED